MREAAVPGYRLSKARRSTRVLITLAMLGLLLGLLSSVFLTISRTGLGPSAVRAYFLGTDASLASGMEKMLAASSPRPFGELLEVTHLHIMGGSMLLFLLCHLLSLCDIEDQTRSALYTTSFVSFLSTFGLPWLIIYAHPGFAYLFGASVIILLISLLVLVAIPVREMWIRQEDRAAWNEERL